MENNNFRLKSFKFSEWINDRLDWDIKKFSIGDFNILLSDNAQGKTRLFNVLRFQKDIHTQGRTFRNPNYRGEATFWFENHEDEIFYHFGMVGDPKGEGMKFNETVKRNKKLLFNRSKKILIDESNDRQVEKFFLPDNVPAIKAVSDKEYKTMNMIQDFISRMVFLRANRFSSDKMEIQLDAMTLSDTGANLPCVLDNWMNKKRLVYNEVIEAFKECFPFIKDVFIKKKSIAPGMSKSPLLFLKEKYMKREIEQTAWSDGLLRAIVHFALACTQFPNNNEGIIRPSFIGVDEVENGLDFNTLAKVINHYISYSNLIQTVLATHSPLACNMVEVNKWLIVRRKGPTVKMISPSNVEDLNSERSKIKKDNWEFYRRHIAKSKLYRTT